MAPYTSITLGAILLIHCTSPAAASVYTVGDSAGWTTAYDYPSWSSGKTFAVGDSLVFNYAAGAHSVNEVTASDYSSCSTSSYLSTDASGTTTVLLRTAGTHYFVCGAPGHCAGGMKLSISVSSAADSPPTSSSTTPSDAIPPPSTPTTSTPTSYYYGAASEVFSTSSATVAVIGAVVAVMLGMWV